MVDSEDSTFTPEDIQARIAEAARKKSDAQFKRQTKDRRAIENKQRKERVNVGMLRGAPISGRDETWTIRAKASQIKAVKDLAEELSEPRAKVSIAALMDEAIGLLLAKYRKDVL